MYQFVNAILRPKGKNKTWVDTDISIQLLNDVFTQYTDGYIVLSDTTAPSIPLYLDYKLLKTLSIPYYNMAFETWLLTLPVAALPTTLVEPVITSKAMLYSDAIQAMFTLTKSGNDAVLHKDNIDTAALHHRVLTSVNGLLHRNTPHEDGESLRILNAVQLKPRSEHNMVGLYSFNDIGVVQQHAITSDMIYDINPATKRYQSVLIKTNIDVTNKSVLLSIAGYLHAHDSTYEVINENPCTIIIRTNRIDFTQRLFEISNHIPLETLGLSTSLFAPDAIANKELSEDSFINNILQMVQSFIIVVDTPNLHIQKEYAIKPPHVGFFECLKEPTFPLMSSTGRELTYWRRKQVDRWVVNIPLQFYPNYLIHTTEYEQDRVVNQSLSEEGYTGVNAYFLGIYSQTLN